MGQLIIGNNVIEYEEKPSLRAKRLIISVDKDQVRVSVPRGVTSKQVREFVESKREWVFRHWQAFREKQSEKTEEKYAEGGSFPYCGRTIFLRTQIYPENRVRVRFSADALWVYLPSALPETERPRLVREALLVWYKRQAKILFQEKLDDYARKMGLQYHQLRIKEQKTKWGSCSSKGNINLNWRVILAPEQVIDYLMIHELSHLRHLNHSQAFWQEVGKYMPDYLQWKKWLRDNGKSLAI